MLRNSHWTGKHHSIFESGHISKFRAAVIDHSFIRIHVGANPLQDCPPKDFSSHSTIAHSPHTCIPQSMSLTFCLKTPAMGCFFRDIPNFLFALPMPFRNVEVLRARDGKGLPVSAASSSLAHSETKRFLFMTYSCVEDRLTAEHAFSSRMP